MGTRRNVEVARACGKGELARDNLKRAFARSFSRARVQPRPLTHIRVLACPTALGVSRVRMSASTFALFFGLLIIVWSLPYLCFYYGRLRHSHRVSLASQQHDVPDDMSWLRSQMAETERAHGRNARRLTARWVQISWMHFSFGLMPMLFSTTLTQLHYPFVDVFFLGHPYMYIMLTPCGLIGMLLTILPTDRRAINFACSMLLYSLLLFLLPLSVLTTLMFYFRPYVQAYSKYFAFIVLVTVVLPCMSAIAVLIPVAHSNCRTVFPRVQLRRVWLALRILLIGAILLTWTIAANLLIHDHFGHL
jgi:hypothetical protein